MTPSPTAALGAALFLAASAAGQTPADTYFSLAITENSHNHVGAAKLFLDFQQAPFGTPNAALGEVISTEVAPGVMVLDGDLADWDPAMLTLVQGTVQSNYPLSEYIDAVPTDLLVGSAWDATHVYFVVRWEDAGHTRSTRYKKWIFGDQGGGETGWNPQRNVGASAGAPNAAAVNASGHVLAGSESEDRVFLMFPIVDAEANYTPLGAGCAMYCHANLDQDFPWQNYTGDGVARMGTNLAGDMADIWHWKAARTEPSGHVDDKWLDFATGTSNGRKSDGGSSAYSGNPLVSGVPTWMHLTGLSYTGDALMAADAVPFSGVPLAGDELPAVVSGVPSGSRADVETAASFDPVSGTWTLELRRLRDTGNADDHSFEGAPAAPPVTPMVTPGSVASGLALYAQHCDSCHFAGGAGLPDSSTWPFPRVQRTSAGLIHHAIESLPIMNSLSGVLSDQQLEDIASYLQSQALFLPTHTLTVSVFGADGGSLVTSDPPGIDCASSCSVEWVAGTPVTLSATAPVGYAFAGWSGPCSGQADCSFLLAGDTEVTAYFVPTGPGDSYCLGDGSAAACPCGNENDHSLRGGLAGCANGSSAGGAGLYAAGSSSVSARDLVLLGEGLPSGQPGLFFQGTSDVAGGAGLPFGDGLRCAGTGIVRLEVDFADGTGQVSTSIDVVSRGGVAAGDVRYYQLWYRDPHGSPCGNLHNLSNGYSLSWTP